MTDRIKALRERMRQLDTDYYIVTTTDSHNSEYVSEHDMVLEYLTGFSGSNGTLLVTPKEALLWTDGRYYIQCEKEIEGTGIKMMREGDHRDPSIEKYLGKHVKSGECIGYNGECITAYRAARLIADIDLDIKVKYDDIAGALWDEDNEHVRPARIFGPVSVQDMEYAGESIESKLARVREKMNGLGASEYILSSLSDIMWLYNIRGEDILYNPVAYSYAFMTTDKAYIFLSPEAFNDKIKDFLAMSGVTVMAYDDLYHFISGFDHKGSILLDRREVSARIYDIVNAASEIIDHVNPTTELKAVKNETEIANMKKYFLADSYATTKYLYTVKKIMGCDIKPEYERYVSDDAFKKHGVRQFITGMDDNGHSFGFDELKAARLCDKIRCDMPDCSGLSFSTIAAYGANAAMMHYEATEDSYAKCEASGMLLTDCGGQYPGATTDVTRTIALGPVTDEQKRDFTLVLKGWLALMHATWLEGCTGRNLDILARQYLWNEGMDYKCGTGHGVGYNLSVHEGPQNIRWRYIEGSSEAVLKPGMVVTNEPGVYKGGRYGIRTENTMLVVERFISDGERYLGFENLTWVPIDEDLIDYSLLDDKEKEQLKDYQIKTEERLSTYAQGK